MNAVAVAEAQRSEVLSSDRRSMPSNIDVQKKGEEEQEQEMQQQRCPSFARFEVMTDEFLISLL